MSSVIGGSWRSQQTQSTVPGAAPKAPIAAPDNSGLRQQLTDLLGTTTDAYNKLMEAGRNNDAFALRDALERFTRSGSKVGVSPWARTQAINDLRARMAEAAKVFQGTTTANALVAQRSVLDAIGTLDAKTFQQALDLRASNLQQSQFLETQKQNAWNRSQAEKAAKAQAEAAAKAQAQQTNAFAPIATPRTPQTTTPQTSNYQFGPTLKPGDKWGWTSGLPAKPAQPVAVNPTSNFHWGERIY